VPFFNPQWFNFNGQLPNSPGVYGITNATQQIIYVGETQDLATRIAQHRADRTHKMHRYAPSLVEFEPITAGEVARKRREQQLIAELNPPANA